MSLIYKLSIIYMLNSTFLFQPRNTYKTQPPTKSI